MKTGDIILYKQSKTFTRWWFLDKIISKFTDSEWVHVGMVLEDPKWLGLKGTYLWESVWSDIKFGVQLIPIEKRIVPGSTYIREYNGPSMDIQNLKKVYQELLDKPYDINPVDWVEAYLGWDPKPQSEKSFWCSAMVACVLTKLGLLEEDTDWSIVVPDFFADPTLSNYGDIKKFK